MYVHKAEMIATLRSRGLSNGADWVDWELPELVDTYKHSGHFHIDPAGPSPVGTPISSE